MRGGALPSWIFLGQKIARMRKFLLGHLRGADVKREKLSAVSFRRFFEFDRRCKRDDVTRWLLEYVSGARASEMVFFQ